MLLVNQTGGKSFLYTNIFLSSWSLAALIIFHVFLHFFLSPSLMSCKFHSLFCDRFSWKEKKNAVLSSHFFANTFLLAVAQISSRNVTCSEFLDPHFMHSVHSLDTMKFRTIELWKYLKNIICLVYFELSNINNNK